MRKTLPCRKQAPNIQQKCGKGVDVLTPVWYDNRRARCGGPSSGPAKARTAAAGRFGAARRKKEEEIIMEGIKAFLKRKNIEISAKRYGIDALGAMAQGLFASLLIGTIINTVGTQFGIGFLTQAVVTVGSGEKAVAYTVGGLASAMSGPPWPAPSATRCRHPRWCCSA